MIVCGIQMHHEPSLCLIKEGEVIWYQEERKLSKRKDITGIPFKCIDLLFSRDSERTNVTTQEDMFITRPYSPILGKVDEFILTGYNVVGVHQVENYLYYKNILPYGKKVHEFYAPHHLAHAYKSYVDSGFKKARVFVVDGRGSNWYLSDKTGAYETSSVYDVSETAIKCIYKKVWSKDNKPKDTTVDFKYHPLQGYDSVLNELGSPGYSPAAVDKNTKFEISSKLDLGRFYTLISEHFGFKEGDEGKFMGYQSSGKFDKKIYNLLKDGATGEKIKNLPLNHNVAHTAQIYFEIGYAQLVKQFECENMVFTGGTALNVINNYKLEKKFKNNNLWFDPLCGDAGNSIGMARAFLRQSYNSKVRPLKNLYISSTPAYKIRIGETETITTVDLKDVMSLLEKGEVVALFQGKSEAGPRALGNRSLLLDPTLPKGKDIMNSIKKRESFRPFACSIIEEEANKWFKMEGIKKSPYMMHAFQAKKIAIQKTPAIVHVDNTCRVQTVTENENEILYKILQLFKVPLIMNTSLNLAGDPINETLEDVLLTMRNSSLKYIYLPEKDSLIKKV